jgi:beta-lactamase regulating signal transducer with metallopeptidase domain
MNITADAISSALVHSLWQNAIIGFLLWVVLVALRHRTANARYLASCGALAVMVALPVVTALVLSQAAVSVEPFTPTAAATIASASDAMPVPPQPLWVETDPDGWPLNWLAVLKPWMLPLWLAGVLVCSLRLVLASMHTVALRRQCAPEQGPVSVMVATLAARMGVRRSVSVRIAPTTMAPATFGLFRPVILVSFATVLGMAPQQLEAVLAHELAHIRRHDYLVNVLQMMAETLFFYHPAIWWASRRIRVERELCCDDVAVQACGDVVCYAQALTSVAKLQIAESLMALGSAGGPLLMRIQRLLGVASVSRPLPPLWVAVASFVLIVAMFTGTYAQSRSPGTLSQNAGDGAALRGRVVDASSGKPVAGASVRAQFITGIENPPRCPIGDCEVLVDPIAGRIPVYRATTAADGSFDVRGVKPGDYDVAAVAPGYLQRYFGQTSDNMPEMPVRVAAGQSATAIEVRLEPAGSVSGRIFSDSGDGLAGVEVELLRRGYLPGGARPMAIAFAQTEDMGTFRFRNVPAGEYYIRAYASRSLAPTREASMLSYTATFFPDVADVMLAQPVIVGGGQELTGIDFALATARKRTVSGRLVDPAGGSLATAMVSLFSISSAEDLRAPVAADGRFRINDVPAADYMLRILDTSNARSWTTAFRDVSVRDDVTGLELVAGASVWIDGRIVRDDRQPLPFDPTTLQLSTHQQTSQMGFNSAGSGKVAADGSFSMRSGAGTMSLRVSGLPPRWFVKSVRLDGVDVTDTTFALSPEGRRRVEIVLSDRVGRLSGMVTDREARAVPNALIVIFPEDRARWDDARLSDRLSAIRTTFSQQRGRYELDGLPIASYRVVAVTSLPRNAWTDPEVVNRLWPFTTSVSLDELRENTLHLKLVPAPTDLLQ